MRRKLNQHLFVYVLCVTLLMTLGMTVQTINKDIAKPDPSPVALFAAIQTHPIAQPPQFERQSSSDIEPLENVILALEQDKKEVRIASMPEATDTIAESAVGDYEVTAHYLNVRANSNANQDTQILYVVKQGTPLEITHTTDNGWLALKSGGFVHGKYAKQIHEIVKVEAEVKTAAIVADSTEWIEPTDDFLVMKPGNSIDQDVNIEPEKPTSAVGKDSGLTEDHIATILKNTALGGQGLEESILEIEDEYGINAYFTIAVMKLESGNGKSKLAKSKNNLFGLNATGGNAHKNAFSFETKGDSVRKFGQLLAKNYVGKGYTTIEKIAKKYCPANPKWASLVTNIMKRDYKKL
ncbi:MAG: glucosaminidase domain-containing protein [Candidatus Pristimantibacillus sp.]